MNTKRVALFVESANYFHSQKREGWFADDEKLLRYCEGFGDVAEATYYIGKETAPESTQQRKLDKLAYIGYSIVTKPIKTLGNAETGRVYQKANFDVEITVDMITTADRYDLAVLVSGDGDFERVIQYLKSRGKEVKVISSRGQTAAEILHAVGRNYIDLADLREELERDERPREPASEDGLDRKSA